MEILTTNDIGSSVWNMGRESGDALLVTLNLGSMDSEMQEKFLADAEASLSDDLTDDAVEELLTHGIWDSICK